ncbi:MAG: Glutamyl-tRNA(Gln) amidotransferase subunit D [Methanoregula sp. PtaU1.Bin006]|nr:MAG: Glutamyl-tRNA(Gln) amidotransferase subunit D [Methanoregula sp. PtaB.Bin085]OPY35630.1 MAG: Glutamyl-tRNA(Gln) amidotransferase subunit D [Methanoregula sp. PtaU1.Bin006]
MDKKGVYITERDRMAVIKLDSGYNIGVPPVSCTLISRAAPVTPQQPQIVQDDKLPTLAIVSTGGTIASRIDYRTGSVTSQFNAADILTAIPELKEIANYRTIPLATILSENMTPPIWQELARAIFHEIKGGARGIIVTHGTDTMAYSAAAISFMVDSPVPIVFVGSQRSADRPSSDNAMNAVCAAAAATSDLGEVAVVMHGTTNDDACAIHRGTRVRKMHTSRRDAFRSLGTEPIGTVEYPSRKVTLTPDAVRRGTREPALHDALDPHCALVQFFPGMSANLLKAYDGYHGLVIAGTGLGHTSTTLIPVLKQLADNGTLIVMTSQCMHGRVCDRVYDTGRDLLDAGIIEGGDTLPEVALVKLMWVLANAPDRKTAVGMMQDCLKGECTRRSTHGL